jgi:hypothetical protein
MQLVIDFIFYLYVYSTCFVHQAPIIRSPLTIHTASSFLCLCLSAALFCKSFLQDSATNRHKHRKLEAVCMVKGLLMMGACLCLCGTVL